MNRFLLLVTIAAALAAATGCGASATRHSAIASGSSVADISTSDPSWTPPGQMEVSYGDDAPEPTQAAPRVRASKELKPNAPAKPMNGAVHAAVY